MNMLRFSCCSLLAVGVIALTARAEMMDRPAGIKIGQRMTLKPYVQFDYTWDSNIDSQPNRESDSSWRINPHLDLSYRAEHFQADLALFYGYRAYTQYARSENEHQYGETLKLAWSNAGKGEKGWGVLLSESFQKVNADDDMRNTDGRGLWRDRRTFQVNGAIERRFNEKWHADVNGSYYYLDYDNNGDQYMNLYGWQRLVGGVEAGYAASKWTDFLISANYQSYTQDNSHDLSGYSHSYGTADRYDRESQGFSVMGGLQSTATERISYRVLAGWSRFEYAGGESTDDGFTYSASGNWRIADRWSTMLMAQSSYQPSEREFGSANRVDSVSWGLAHTMIRGKLNATFDLAYRRETRCYTDVSAWDYDEDIFSGRLGLDYTLNRYLAIYAHGEYQKCLFNGDMGGIERDYDRFRVSVGFRLQY